MRVAMYIDLSSEEDVEEAYKEYEKAKMKLVRCLERERLTAKEETASGETNAVK